MRYFICCGIVLWLGATLLFRLWGDELMNPAKPFIWLSFVLVVPAILFILNRLFGSRNISPGDRPKAALFIAVPGMLLDLFSVGFHPIVFPSLPEAHLHIFFVWLLWAYALILLGGLMGAREMSKVS